jgi:hypothetical protein
MHLESVRGAYKSPCDYNPIRDFVDDVLVHVLFQVV